MRTYNGYTWDFAIISAQLYRVTKVGGVVVWVVGDATVNGSETGTSFRQALGFMGLGFKLHDTMIYWRDEQFPDTRRYNSNFEYMFVLSKYAPKSVNLIRDKINVSSGRAISGTRRSNNGKLENCSNQGQIVNNSGVRSNIWYFSTGLGGTTTDKDAFAHPAIFPEALARDHIISWSNPGDTVIDPMMGSGTVGKMCALMDRKFIGIEISEEYCEIAVKRIERVLSQPKLFPWVEGQGLAVS